MYDGKSIDFSEYDELDISCGMVKTGVQKGFITYKATHDRSVNIIGDFNIEIPKGQQGELYIYDEEKDGSIWQAICHGCFHSALALDKYFYSFSAIAA